MKFYKKTLDRIRWSQEVLRDEGDGPMTIRQVFYQLVTKNLIQNNAREYDNLDYALIRAREEKIIPWSDIIDRTREAISYAGWVNLADYLSDAPYRYRRDKLQSQKKLVELWVEKQALAGFFEEFAIKYQVTLVVGRGYQSGSALYKFCEERFKSQIRPIYIAYFGDWDPSGIDIDRSFREKMLKNFGVEVNFKRYALTEEDIKRLPHNYAKPKDPRFKEYRKGWWGERTWELDALPKHELLARIQQATDDHLDKKRFEEEVEMEEEEKEKLHNIIDKLKNRE